MPQVDRCGAPLQVVTNRLGSRRGHRVPVCPLPHIIGSKDDGKTSGAGSRGTLRRDEPLVGVRTPAASEIGRGGQVVGTRTLSSGNTDVMWSGTAVSYIRCTTRPAASTRGGRADPTSSAMSTVSGARGEAKSKCRDAHGRRLGPTSLCRGPPPRLWRRWRRARTRLRRNRCGLRRDLFPTPQQNRRDRDRCNDDHDPDDGIIERW